MLVLGVESAADQCGCALVDERGVIAEARLALPRRHAEALAPQMRFVCEQAGVALGDVDVVAVDSGPGLYTGLRAGLATAKATAGALGVPVVAVGSLEALAFGARPRPGDTVVSVLDARRDEVFWAWYRCIDPPRAEPGAAAGFGDAVGGLVPLSDPQVGAPAVLVAELISAAAGAASLAGSAPVSLAGSAPAGAPSVPPPAGETAPSLPAEPGAEIAGDILVVGDGALRYADMLAVSPRVVIADGELRFPSPAAVALLGRERALAGGTMPPEDVEPLYLRPPDARPQPQPPAT